MPDVPIASRNVVFISKATPGDDEFVLWLAPRLEAAGYTVYADIIRLDPGTRWRQELTTTLQDQAIKMLLCCRDHSLARNGVQEEIGIAEDLARELNDPRFIIPLRLESYKKVFGIGGCNTSISRKAGRRVSIVSLKPWPRRRFRATQLPYASVRIGNSTASVTRLSSSPSRSRSLRTGYG